MAFAPPPLGALILFQSPMQGTFPGIVCRSYDDGGADLFLFRQYCDGTQFLKHMPQASTGTPGAFTFNTGAAPQVNADWNATSGPAQILNQPPITWNGTTVTIQGVVDVQNHKIGNLAKGTAGTDAANVSQVSTIRVNGTLIP